MAERKYFGSVVDYWRGEVTLGIGSGTYINQFNRAMNGARIYGVEYMKDRIIDILNMEISAPEKIEKFKWLAREDVDHHGNY